MSSSVKLWVVGNDILMRHAGSKPTQNIGNRDTHPADAGTPSALSGLDGNDGLIVHALLPL